MLSCGVLEHVQDPDASLDEIRRVLRPGGTFYVTNLPNRYSYTENGSPACSGATTTVSCPNDRVYTETNALEPSSSATASRSWSSGARTCCP